MPYRLSSDSHKSNIGSVWEDKTTLQYIKHINNNKKSEVS